MVLPISVLVPTRNEELNIEKALQSIKGLANQICVIELDKPDKTEEIVKNFCVELYVLPYEPGRLSLGFSTGH